MQKEYIKEELIIEKNEGEKELEIMSNISKVKKELEIARKNFEYVRK